MNNLSIPQENDSLQNTANVPGIIAYHTVFMLVVTIPVTVINIAIVVALTLENSITTPIRIVLINTPIACIIVAVGLFVNQVASLCGSTTGIDPPMEVCRLAFFCWGIGGAGRLSFMAAYAITVYLMVHINGAKLGTAKLKAKFVFIAIALVWLFVFLFIFWFLVPFAFAALFDQASCVPLPTTESGIAFTIVYCLVFGLICFSITIIFPIITLLYVKKNTLKENNDITTALAKFAFFLLVGNVINILSEILPTVLAATVVDSGSISDVTPISKIVLSIVAISLIPPPIFILAYFKKIRMRLLQPCMKKTSHQPHIKSSSKDTESV